MNPMLTFRTLVLCMITAMLALSPQQADAQFLKKLKDRVEKAAEDAVLDNAERKTREKTNKTIDGALDGESKDRERKTMSMPSSDGKVADSYSFEWNYELVASDGKRENTFAYMLREDGAYMGMDMSKMTDGQAGITIMDFSEGRMITVMNQDGQKSALSMKMPHGEELIDDAAEGEDFSGMQITELGSKMIAGYECQGYLMESDEMKSTVYVLHDAPAQLMNFGAKASGKYVPKGIDPAMMKKFEGGLMMEMDYQSKKKAKDKGKMRCVKLERDPVKFDMTQYQVMSF